MDVQGEPVYEWTDGEGEGWENGTYMHGYYGIG
jgi:hypothetical protein